MVGISNGGAGFVVRTQRIEERLGIARRAGIICPIAYHQCRHSYLGRTTHAICIGMLVAPLRKPAAQCAKAGQPNGAHVDDFRVTEKTPARLSPIRVYCGVEPFGVRHSAVHHKALLTERFARGLKRLQSIEHPSRNALATRSLGSASAQNRR